MRPSFIGLFATGLLNLAVVILFLLNYKKLTSVQLLGVVLLFSISIGIHSLLHGHQEIHYGFNPLKKIKKIMRGGRDSSNDSDSDSENDSKKPYHRRGCRCPYCGNK